MQATINGKVVQFETGQKICQVAPNFDIYIRNGYGIAGDSLLEGGDKIIASKNGEMVSEDLLYQMLTCRNGEFATERLKNAVVCVCGLGGLGSNIAIMLARLGVGKLVLIDFDLVDITNLNRQNYFVSDVGKPKTTAMANMIANINPYTKVVTHNTRANAENILDLIGESSVVVEAFDNPKSKAEIVSCILENTDKFVVASSGMAGYGSSNQIKTTSLISRLYVCGDGTTEAKEGVSLMSPRVVICAGHQANMVLRLLIGELEC